VGHFEGLLELKNRAIKENVSYIETEFSTIPSKNNSSCHPDQHELAKLHNDLKIDNERFTMRYQNFVLRFMEPVDLFKNLVVAFISADSSPLAGVISFLRKTAQLP
jgi:adenosine deaminase/adenosine deaminase CECR1